jgi:hypothetical protein
MNSANTTRKGWEDNIKRQTVRLAVWTIAWLVTLAIASFGPKFLWDWNEWISAAAIGINVLVGIGMIVANKNHLRSLDEMQQKIYLEAMAISLGAGLVGGIAYSNLEVSNVIPFHAEIAHVVILMSLTFIASLAILNRKYA